MSATTVGINIVGQDLASPAFLRAARNAETSSKRMNSAFKSSIGMAAKLAGGFAAFELVKKAIDIGKEASLFQAKMLLIQTQAGATSGEIKDFSKALLSMSGRVAASPEALATSLYHVYSTGKRGSEALHIVETAAKGARIGMADLEETTNALTSTVVSGIDGVKDMSSAMGALNTIVGAGDMNLTQLNEALATGILPVAKSYGVSLNEIGAALATFGDNIQRGTDAGSQLRQALMALGKPIAGGAAALATIGLKAKDLQNDLSKGGLTRALDDLASHMKKAGIKSKETGVFLTEAFGRKVGVGLPILINQIDRYHTKLVEIAKGAHDFDKSWAATKKTTSFVFDRLGAQVTAAGITIANKLMPPITQAAAILGDTLPGAFSKLGSILAPFGSFVGGALSAAWHVFGAALSVVGAALGPIISLIDSLKTPLGAIATVAIGAVVAFKLFAAIPGIIEAVALKTMYARDAVVGFGVASKAMATNFVAQSAVVVGAAEASSLGVTAAGTAARIGWAGILGPIGAVAVGVGLLVSMFHRSSGASKEAAAAAKAYTEALKTGDSTGGTVFDTIVAQLADNNIPQRIADLNKEFKNTGITAGGFAHAIDDGGKSAANMRARLQDLIKTAHDAAHANVDDDKKWTHYLEQERKAEKLLKSFNTQYETLTKATKKDLIDTKAFAGVSSSIDKVSQSTHVASDTAKKYAGMLGIVVDKNGVAAVGFKTLNAAVHTVAKAYASASQSGDDFLKALDSFSSSAGTAADRAALIGATLKAANGDALNFATAMIGVYSANRDLVAGFAGDASKIKDLRKQIADLKKTSDGSVASTEQLAALQKNLGDAYKDSERAAINLNRGTIDYAKGGAPALVGQLSAIQDAAMKAAGAVYQHEVSTKGAKRAAEDAYKLYVTQTRGQFIDEHKQLGLTRKQAKKLADQYFGMPKNVKTLISAEGTNPVVTVLNKIGQLLANLTGQQWDVGVNLIVSRIVSGTGAGSGHGTGSRTPVAQASGTGGGVLPHGWAWVGDPGPHSELTHTTSRGTQVISAPRSKKIANHMGWKIPGYAGGTVKPHPTYSYGGQEYASQAAANNARARDAQQAAADQARAIGDVRTAMRGLIVVAKTFSSTGADLKDAAKQLREAAKAGKVSADVLARFSREQHRLTRLGNRRDRIRERLGTAPTAPTAYDRLATAQDAYRNARSTVSSAVGAFDVTTAGASQYGEPVTAGGILAQIKKAAAKAKRFVSLLRKLIKEGLPRQLVEQLAQAGPQAYDQAAALASSTPAQMRQIRAAYRSITSSGDAAGRMVANHYYRAGVDSAQALVNGLKSKESALTAAIKRLAEKMVKQLRRSLDMHSPSRVLYNEARLAFSGYENGIHSKHGDIVRATSRIGSASVPGRSGRFGSGGDVHHHYNIDSPELHVHYPLEGDLQEGVKQLARMLPQQIRAQSQGLDR